MTNTTIIITVGSSLLRNCGWSPGHNLPQREVLADEIRRQNAEQSASELLIKLCVETHMLVRLDERTLKDAELYLIHSDTPEGLLVAEALKAGLTQSSVGLLRFEPQRLELIRLQDLNVRAEGSLDTALRGYVGKISELLCKLKACNRTILFCATGGYKVEAAYAYMTCLLHRVRICYLFEKYRKPIDLPRLPLVADLETIKQQISPQVLCKLHKCDNPQHGLPASMYQQYESLLAPFVERDVEGSYRVNTLGEALMTDDVYTKLRPPEQQVPLELGFVKREQGHAPKDVLDVARKHLAGFPGATHIQIANWRTGNRWKVLEPSRDDAAQDKPWTLTVEIPTNDKRKGMIVNCVLRLPATCWGEAKSVRQWLCEHLDERRSAAVRTIISTVGISLARAAARRHANRRLTAEDLLGFLADEPLDQHRLLCAEINGLRALQLSPGDRLIFIHSDTPEGTACAEALHLYFTPTVSSSSTRRIEALTELEDEVAASGIRSLLYTVGREIVDAKPSVNVVVLNLTGGFKIEMAFCLALACLFPEVEAGYIHEEMRSWLRLPTLPLRLDLKRVKPFLPLLSAVFFAESNESPRRNSRGVKAVWNTDPEMAAYLFTVDNDRLQLAGFGHIVSFLYDTDVGEAWAQWLPPADPGTADIQFFRPPAVDSFLRALAVKPFVRRVRVYPSSTEATILQTVQNKDVEILLRLDDYQVKVTADTTAEDSQQMSNVKEQVMELLKEHGLLS